MHKTNRTWLVAATSLVVIGLVLFAVSMTEHAWDFTKLRTEEYETNIHGVTEKFSNISINTDTADIVFALSGDGSCNIACYEKEKSRHSVTVSEDTLSINITNEKAWYDYIGIHFGSPKITVSLPQAEYAALFISESTGDIDIPNCFKFASVNIASTTGDIAFHASASETVQITASTGDIRVADISTGNLALSVSTGRINISNVICSADVHICVSTGKTKMENVGCKNLISTGDTGDISLTNVIATEAFSIERDTGDVRFEHADAGEITVQTDTGDITGSLLSSKIFIAQADTGSIHVPKTVTGGKCELHSDTGDIRITVKAPI